jgi:hypothetical protein
MKRWIMHGLGVKERNKRENGPETLPEEIWWGKGSNSERCQKVLPTAAENSKRKPQMSTL